jgi:cytochrome d ubiquinol oxidase subunit II
MGALAGGLARQRLTVTGGEVQSGGGAALWIGPWQGVIGLLALASCTALAAALLTVRLEGRGEWTLAAGVRRQGRVATITMLVLAAVALVLARSQAPQLYGGLTGRALPAVIAGFAALVGATWANAHSHDRWTAGGLALAVVALIWGWGIAQFPVLVGPGVTVGSSQAPDAELHAVAIALGAGAILLTPSLWLLHGAFRRTARAGR